MRWNCALGIVMSFVLCATCADVRADDAAAAPGDLPAADHLPIPSAPIAAPSSSATAGTLQGSGSSSLTPVPDSHSAAPAASDAPVVGYSIAPVPVTAGNGWQGGWSAAYAPGYYYWHHVPHYTYGYPYVPGYAPGIEPTSWNGYWNYSTAYSAPGLTAWWHGWYTGPYYADAWPTWSYSGWGYSTIGWGHGYWHRPLVHAPRYHLIHRWW